MLMVTLKHSPLRPAAPRYFRESRSHKLVRHYPTTSNRAQTSTRQGQRRNARNRHGAAPSTLSRPTRRSSVRCWPEPASIRQRDHTHRLHSTGTQKTGHGDATEMTSSLQADKSVAARHHASQTPPGRKTPGQMRPVNGHRIHDRLNADARRGRSSTLVIGPVHSRP